MNGADDQRDFGFEERMRELLAEDAHSVQPSPAPYPAIRRRGLAERRRRVAVTGAVLATLAAVPVGAYAVAGGNGGRGADTAAPKPSVGAPRTPTAQASGTAGADAASGGQLLDGVTAEQAREGLEKCLAYDDAKPSGGLEKDYLGDAGDYRMLLAMRSTGDTNSPGDGIYVVAVKEKTDVRLICTLKGGEASGINVSSPDAGPTGLVVSDINGGKLYQQSFLDKGNWKLPFRWGVIGTVEPSVAKVTVSYGESSATATLDHGWFVAAGILNRQVTVAPHIKGFDATGRLVYDSDTDETYERTLP
ncbi:hypothetical protein [Streptomyces sp. NPDC020951]|uniref:hypothetical protein n=1 Tax=Streptomyces sp. NPDC020951 TaxID=3365104 RepID=UPI0037A860A4